MSIPDELLANITELGLNEVHYNEDKAKFLTVVKHLIMKTRRLKFLRISPIGQNASWIALLAGCASVLTNLESLIINANIGDGTNKIDFYHAV